MAQSGDMYLEVATGQTVFREGDPGSEMYIIESGSIDILRIDRGSTPLARLEAGDFFGEMAVLEDQPRFATALAVTPVRLLKIDRAAFSGVLSSNVEIAVRIMRKLTARLRRAEQRASEAQSALDGLQEKLSVRPGPDSTLPAPPIETRMGKVAQQPNAPVVDPAIAERLTTPVPPARAPARPVPVESAQVLMLFHVQSGQKFVLQGTADFLVGRPDPVTGTTPEINLGPLDLQRSLSRRHAKVVRSGDNYCVREEVGTLNGTWVNADRAKPGESISFAVGDLLRFGTVELEVRTA